MIIILEERRGNRRRRKGSFARMDWVFHSTLTIVDYENNGAMKRRQLVIERVLKAGQERKEKVG